MEIKTILFSLFLINLFLGLFILTIKQSQKTYPGINSWIIASLLISFGYLLMWYRTAIPDIISVIVAQALFIFAGITRIYGFNNFFEKKFLKDSLFFGQFFL